jgi:hypothetical protein
LESVKNVLVDHGFRQFREFGEVFELIWIDDSFLEFFEYLRINRRLLNEVYECGDGGDLPDFLKGFFPVFEEGFPGFWRERVLKFRDGVHASHHTGEVDTEVEGIASSPDGGVGVLFLVFFWL